MSRGRVLTAKDREVKPYHVSDEVNTGAKQKPDAPDLKKVKDAWDDENELLAVLENYGRLKMFFVLNYKKNKDDCHELMKHIVKFPKVFDSLFATRAEITLLEHASSPLVVETAVGFIIEHPDTEVSRLVKNESDIKALNNFCDGKATFFADSSQTTFVPAVKKISSKNNGSLCST